MTKIRFHPAWVFLFVILGLAFGIVYKSWIPVWIALAAGIIVAWLAGKTPSRAIQWNKGMPGQVLTWAIIIMATALLLVAMF